MKPTLSSRRLRARSGSAFRNTDLRATIHRLYNARTRKGLFTVTRDAAGVTLAAALVDEVDGFFAALDERANFRKGGAKCACGEPDFVPDTISARLAALQVRVGEVVRRTEDEFLKAEMQELGRRIRDARDRYRHLPRTERRRACLLDRTNRKSRAVLTLNAAPIDIAPVLRRMIFREDAAACMTSATLAVGRPDLAYFRRRIGADRSGAAAAWQPFRFHGADEIVRRAKNARSARSPVTAEALAEWVAHFVEETDGRAFVLFTSYRGMQQLARRDGSRSSRANG